MTENGVILGLQQENISDVNKASTIKTKTKAMASRPRPWPQGQGQNRTNKAYNADITLISVQHFFAFIKGLLPVLRLTELSDNDRKFVAFGRKNTGISQINGLDDLCQGRPSKVN